MKHIIHFLSNKKKQYNTIMYIHEWGSEKVRKKERERDTKKDAKCQSNEVKLSFPYLIFTCTGSA
jgi:hypothetical protein